MDEQDIAYYQWLNNHNLPDTVDTMLVWTCRLLGESMSSDEPYEEEK